MYPNYSANGNVLWPYHNMQKVCNYLSFDGHAGSWVARAFGEEGSKALYATRKDDMISNPNFFE